MTTTLAKAKLDLYEPVPRESDGAGFTRGSPIGTIDFRFNPKEYSTSMQADWKVEAKQGGVEAPAYTGCKPMTMSVELFLDGDGTDTTVVANALELLTKAVRPAPGSKEHPCPPLAKFSWGTGWTFMCVVQSVSASVTMFTPGGQPLRATCKLNLLEYETAPAGTNPTSGGERSVKTRQVGLGDTLASIANDELGNPSQWRAIAVTNRIEDPFSLVVGSELLIPARSDVPELA